MYIHADEDTMNQAVELLRQFPAGAHLVNVANVFNSELRASMARGALMPNSRLGQLSDWDYERERRNVEALAKLWGTAVALTPEELLQRVVDKGIFSELLACRQFLTTRVPNYPPIKGEMSMSNSTRRLYVWLDDFFGGATNVRNPLVGLADAVRQGSDPLRDAGSRAHALHDLEWLSCELWHMVTIADAPTLCSRIVLHPQHALIAELLHEHRALLGLPQGPHPLGSFSEYERECDNQLSSECPF